MGAVTAGNEPLVVALARGLTQEQAAAAGGLSVRTVQRRVKDPAFRRQVQETRAALLDQCMGRMSRAAVDAAEVLHTLLTDSQSEKVRMAAARSILELFPRIQQAQELELRVAALEASLDGGEQR